MLRHVVRLVVVSGCVWRQAVITGGRVCCARTIPIHITCAAKKTTFTAIDLTAFFICGIDNIVSTSSISLNK